MHHQIDAGKPHQKGKDKSRPAIFLVAHEKQSRHGGEGGGGMAGGEAHIALHILPYQQPKLVEDAALIGVGTGPGNGNFQKHIGEQRADGHAKEHGGAEAAGRPVEHQGQAQQHQEDAPLTKKGNKRKKRGEKTAGHGVQPVHQQRDALVKSGKAGVQPQCRGSDLHRHILPRLV